MPVSIPDLWNLVVASRLAAASSIPKLQDQFSQVKGADTQGNSTTLAQWLISQGVLSKYQAKVLLAGHAGPFIYGEYTVYDRVSSGRLQGVFRAIHPPTRVRVTLSFHSGAAVQNAQWWAILVDQIGTLAQAVHPNLARVYHLVDLGQFKFTSIEELQGESAGERLAKGPVPWGPACRMIRQVAAGLTKLLEMGQLHGAVRPSNVWINAEENAKLLLPPLARDPLAIPGPIDLSAPHPSDELLRQADYMAPELGQVGHAPDPRTEVYALGCTLFHLLARRPPYIGRDPLSKLASHAAEKIPTVDQPSLPPILNQVLAGMLAKDPARRYQHPRQVSDVLGQVLAKFEPDQLKWRASPTPNRLPEFEAWIQPYKMAVDSQKHYAPDIEMPPILAASMTPPPVPSLTSSGTDEALDVLSPDPTPSLTRTPPPFPSGAGGPAKQSRGGPPTVAQTPNVPAKAHHTPPPIAKSVVKPSPSPAGTATAPLPVGMSNMIFPPDQDVLVPAVRTRKPPRASKKSNVAVLASGVLVLIATSFLLWAVLHKKHNAEPAAADKPSESTTGEKSTDGDAPTAKPDDGSSAPGAIVKPAAGNEPAPPKNTGAGLNKSDRNQSILTSVNENSSPAASSDDGKPLWTSPTNGAPLSLAHLPPGVQAVLVLRPAELLANAEGEKLLAALGPEGVEARHELESMAGTSLPNVEQLTVAWIDDNDPAGQAAMVPIFVFRFAQRPEKEKLLAAWGNPTPAPVRDETMFPTALGVSAFLPKKDSGKILVVGPAAPMQESADLAGEPPPVRREIEKLIRSTDDARQATLLWLPDNSLAPSAIAANTPWTKLMSAAQSFLGDDCRGAALSVQLTPASLFLELHIAGPLDISPETEARQIRGRIVQLPAMVEDYLASLDLNSHGRRILLRFPQMLRVTDEFTRSGVDANQAVLRCYLPVEAAHNLLMGAELALAESASPAKASGGLAAKLVGGPSQNGDVAQSESVAQKLKRITTLTFPNENLERALSLLADDIHVKVEILGGDLQLDGITKNQPIRDLDEKNKPAEEILRTIMRKANPDGKLVYVIKRPPAGGDEELLITTRAAATKRGDKLPPELAVPPKAGKEMK